MKRPILGLLAAALLNVGVFGATPVWASSQTTAAAATPVEHHHRHHYRDHDRDGDGDHDGHRRCHGLVVVCLL